MLCVCNHSGHRLRTWIPILILIQCGLICLYIAIIQDKSRTQSSSYSDKLSQPREKSLRQQQPGIYDNPLHVGVAFGNTQYDNEGGSNLGRVPGNPREYDGNEPEKRLSSLDKQFAKALWPTDAFTKTGRSYLTRFNSTLKNSTHAEIALQVGNIVRFQSSNTAESKVLEEKRQSGLNNERQLSVGIQPLESISASSRPLVEGKRSEHLMTQHSPDASATRHYIQFNEAEVKPDYNRTNKKLQFTSHKAKSNRGAQERGVELGGHSEYPSSNKDALRKAAAKSHTVSQTAIDQGDGSNGNAAGSRWRKEAHDKTQSVHVAAGPYAHNRQNGPPKLPQFSSTQNMANFPVQKHNGSTSAEEQQGKSKPQSVIDNHPRTTESSPLSSTKHIMAHKGPHHNTTIWPPHNAKSSTAKTMYGIHTQNRKHRTAMNNSSHGTNLFHGYDPLTPPVFHLLEDNATYFSEHGRALRCMNEGTENIFLQGKQEACICKPAWHGEHCSVPDSAMYTSALRYINTLQPVTKPRRLINAINFNVEWELLEARFHELDDLVDVFLLVESNYTMYGDPKPLRLLERLKKGYLQEFHHKISYLFVHTFPVGGRENGWIVDQFARRNIGKEGLGQIQGVRPDDVFIYTDADEIPSRDVLLFLKLHYGYPEPFGLALRWSVFGFFWKQYDLTRIMVGCSVKMLRYVFQSDVYKLRTGTFQMQVEEHEGVKEFMKNGGIMFEWYFGDGGAHAGWHCSWCMPPDRIRIKLTSAINADFPRWGDYPEKRDLTYIRNLIKTGTWFDDKMTFNSLVDMDSDPNLAPNYMIANFDTYKHLLDLKHAG